MRLASGNVTFWDSIHLVVSWTNQDFNTKSFIYDFKPLT